MPWLTCKLYVNRTYKVYDFVYSGTFMNRPVNGHMNIYIYIDLFVSKQNKL